MQRILVAALLGLVACSSNETTTGSGTTTSSTGAQGGGGTSDGGGGAGAQGGGGSAPGGAGGDGGSGGQGGGIGGMGGEGGMGGQGGAGTFPAILGDGIWLVGWSGGLDHYSWMKFTFLQPAAGTLEILDAECPSCTGFFDCEGMGAFTVDVQSPADDVTVAACNLVPTFDFQSFGPPPPFFPSAILEAQIVETQTMNPLVGLQFGPMACDPGFTQCINPFQ
jgi:hypothetical protein